MSTKIIAYAKTFMHLLHADLTGYKQLYVHKLINALIWAGIVILVTAYMFPMFGMNQNIAMFAVATVSGVTGIMELFPNVAAMTHDLHSNRVLSYEVTLPLPTWMVLVKVQLFYACTSALVGLWTLPFGLALIPTKIDMSHFAFGKFLLMFVASSLFFGSFSFFLTTFVKNMRYVSTIWSRVVFPLWFLGGFQFSWHMLKTLNPTLAYISLANPFVYVMEGMRAAILGQDGSLPFWYCLAATLLLTTIIGYIGTIRFAKKLDCV
jgi:ABC-2 type transport system permease protein